MGLNDNCSVDANETKNLFTSIYSNGLIYFKCKAKQKYEKLKLKW